MKHQQAAFLSRAGVGPFTNPGNEKFWLDPGKVFTRGYGVVLRGCDTWAFGESTGNCNINTGNPARVVYHEKHMIIRSLTIWCAGPGRLFLKDLETGTTMMKWHMKDAGTVHEIPFGRLGVDIGYAPYFQWAANSGAGSEKVWLVVSYDLL